MATRFVNKPDPSIKKNVLRTRAAARNARTAHASVVATSVAATIFAWALFSNQDAQLIEAARQSTSNQAAITITAPAQSAAIQLAAGLPLIRSTR